MIHKELNIGRWSVDFLFGPDGYDTEQVLVCLYDADASDDILVKAYHILEDDDNNTGFTFTNQNLKKAVVVVGPTSSGDEFVNTLVHELYHVAAAIADGLGLDYQGEGPAYIIGDSAMDLTHIVCELGCPGCN